MTAFKMAELGSTTSLKMVSFLENTSAHGFPNIARTRKTQIKVGLSNPYSSGNRCHLTCVTRKQTLRSLSLSYQKKDGRPWPRPSFFWYDTVFSEFDSADIIDHILEMSVSYQKNHVNYKTMT